MSDEQLVELAQSGDSNAMEQLCVRFKQRVRIAALPYYIIGADKDDLIQEGMIGLYKAIRGYDPSFGSGFSHFADICVTRQMISAIRSAHAEKHYPLNSYVSLQQTAAQGGEELEGLIPGGDNPEDTVIIRESTRSFIKELLSILTPLERQTVSLFLKGLSHEQIARRTGHTKRSVDNALSRVRGKAARLMRAREA